MKRDSILVKFTMVLLVVMLVLTGCGKSPEAARKELAALNVEYTTDGFLKSVEANDMVAIELFIEAGMDVNTKDLFERTPLMIASNKGHLEVIKSLLSKSADVNILDDSNQGALEAAVAEGHIEIVKLLLAKGAKENILSGKITTLMIALTSPNNGSTKLLIENGADINAISEKGFSPLFYALISATDDNDERDLLLLLNNNVDINIKIPTPSGNYTPLMMLIENEKVLLVEEFLKKGANANGEADNGNTPLIASVIAENQEIIKLLLSYGADINKGDIKGRTSLIAAILTENQESIDLILSYNPELNYGDMEGKTPLMYAIESWNETIVEKLLAKGADPNFKTYYGISHLELAEEEGQTAIIDILKKGGAAGESKVSSNNSRTLYKDGVFSGSKQEQAFKNLVKDKYELFVETFQMIIIEDDLDGFGATVSSGAVPGLYTIMEAIVMVDNNDTIWAAIIDDDVVRYYTNSSNKTQLPATIENWRSRFTEIEVVFMNK